MASDITLQGLIDLARLYADQRPGSGTAFVPDTGSGSMVTLINGACAEFYDLLVRSGGHEYFAKDSAISIVPGTATYACPSDFYQEITIHLEWNNQDWEYVAPFENAERMRLVNFTTWGRRTPKGYRIFGAQTLTADQEASIEFSPTPTTTVTGRLRYVPTFTNLSNVSTDNISTVNGWHKLIALKVAMELRVIARMDMGDLAQLYSSELERITDLADKRAQGATPQIVDVEAYRQMPEWAADRRWI